MSKPMLGIFGGSGFYRLEGRVEKKFFASKWGEPSAGVQFATLQGKSVAFLPRHGVKHLIPPHKINFRANVEALAKAGVSQVLGPFACGSLQPEIKPGDFVIADQFFDRTHGRQDTFFEGPKVVHVSMAEPYCPRLRKACVEAAKDAGVRAHPKGTVVVINGPRFSTKAESRWFSREGWSAVTMAQYPENVLCREAGLCYAGVGLVTDYDAGLAGRPQIKPVTAIEVVRVFKENNERLSRFIAALLQQPELSKRGGCGCAMAAEAGRI